MVTSKRKSTVLASLSVTASKQSVFSLVLSTLVLFFGCQGSLLFAQEAAFKVRGLKRNNVESPFSLKDQSLLLSLDASVQPEQAVLNVRIRNASSNREKIITLKRPFRNFGKVPDPIVNELTVNGTAQMSPKFSVLTYRRRVEVDSNLTDSVGAKSLMYDQPLWIDLGFRLTRENGKILIVLDPRLETTVLSGAQAAMFQGKIDQKTIQKLFKLGWDSIRANRFDLAEEAFVKLVARQDLLVPEKKSEASLGLAISLFNQKGCSESLEHLAVADREEKFKDDVSFYRARCFMETKRDPEAEPLFKALSEKNHPNYGDQSRFYLAVVADVGNRFDDADAGYSDVIDFAKDPELQKIARARLDNLRARRLDYEYQHKWFNLILSQQFGFDTNVVSLPSTQTAASAGVSSKSAVNAATLGLLDLRVPWKSKTWDQKFSYMFLNLHYFKDDLSKTFDLQLHDVSMPVAYKASRENEFEFKPNYSSVFLGPISTSKEFMALFGGALKWKKKIFKGEAPLRDFENTLKITATRPKTVATVPDLDSTAMGYKLSSRATFYERAPHMYSVGLDAEIKLAAGKENSMYATALNGNYSLPMGPETWQTTLSNDVGLTYTSYFRAASPRYEMLTSYTAGIGRLWASRYDTRLQGVANFNTSNNSSKKYNKFQINAVVLAIF